MIESVKPAPGAKGKIPWHIRRLTELRAKGTTPRDLLFDDDIQKVDAPQQVKDTVRFFWMSTPMAERRPVLTGFSHDCYTPVDEELMKELKVKVKTPKRNAAGVPVLGDLFLVACPKEIADEQDAVWLESSAAGPRMAAEQQRLQEKLAAMARGAGAMDVHTGIVGEVETSRDLNQLSGIAPAEPGEVRETIGKALGRGENDGQS